MSINNISFILHKPQLSENIGACARGMKNFNFNKLIVIDPKPIFPNDKILATSVGAKNIINKAKNFGNLEKPLKNIDIVIATSARFRNKNIKHIQLEDLKKINYKKKIAFLFGSEASGLSNNEISYANYTLQIPTNPDFKSLNLSHSLIIIAQYLSSIINSKASSFKKSNKVKSASKKDIVAMANLCIKNLEEIGASNINDAKSDFPEAAFMTLVQRNKHRDPEASNAYCRDLHAKRSLSVDPNKLSKQQLKSTPKFQFASTPSKSSSNNKKQKMTALKLLEKNLEFLR